MKIGKEHGKTQWPKKEYDAVIIGGGGHGLATAYYLAKKHNMKNIAVSRKRLDWWW
jgi:sarcosine oxidase subunit beta